MQTVIAQPNQSIYDIAVQATGSYDNAQAIADANEVCTTDLLTPGAVLLIPDGLATDQKVIRYYSGSGRIIIPATGDVKIGGFEQNEGLDYWEIETEFVINN